jgi:pimeloyl-ACP methyl ester carboxylesterase
MHLHCTGAGTPTVAFESGASSFAIDWSLVQPEVARTNRVCSYDRAGYGWSEVGEVETPDRIVRNLHALLEAGGEKPPYVIVGASVGALYARLYQRRYPSEIAGMVQVDPSNEGRYVLIDGKQVPLVSVSARELADSIPPGKPSVPPARPPQTGHPFDRLPPDLYRIRIALDRQLIDFVQKADITRQLIVESEEGLRAALVELRDAAANGEHPLGNLPLVVLTRGSANTELRALHASRAQQSTRGRQVIVEGAAHEIHLTHPHEVAAAIREVAR